MPRAPQLSEEERAVILQYSKDGIAIADIARRLQRSRKVISNFLRSPEEYGNRKRPGRPKVNTTQDLNRIKRA